MASKIVCDVRGVRDTQNRLNDTGTVQVARNVADKGAIDLECRTFECAPVPGDRGESRGPQNRPRIHPIVILITSDPTLPRDLAEIPPAHPIRFGYEVLSTLVSYEHVRGGRGAEAAREIKKLLSAGKPLAANENR